MAHLNPICISNQLRDKSKAKYRKPAMQDKINVTLYLIFRDLEIIADEQNSRNKEVP